MNYDNFGHRWPTTIEPRFLALVLNPKFYILTKIPISKSQNETLFTYLNIAIN